MRLSQGKPFEYDPCRLAERLEMRDRRIMIFGQPGTGKTSLAAGLALQIAESGSVVRIMETDPGSPAFGVPGAVCLGIWREGQWARAEMEALCTLDAARFRLPLTAAVGHLAGSVTDGTLLLDAPGVIRGVAGAELLEALVRAAAVDLVLVLIREGQSPPLVHELNTLPVPWIGIQAPSAAHRPGKAARDRKRSQLWDHHLLGANQHQVDLGSLDLLGTPPRKAPEAWLGKQVAFLRGNRTLAFGEVAGLESGTLRVLLPADTSPTGTLLVRDAGRDDSGLLVSGKRFAHDVVRYVPPSDLLPDAMVQGDANVRPLVHAGDVTATLMNGVFGDPLLHLRLRHQRRSLMFDLGDGSRLPARIAHQLSDVFISHAHVDHIAGFIWLLRSRIGEASLCRLYGPPGLAGHIEGLISGIRWDRIGDRGPRFEVLELHGDNLKRYALQAGKPGAKALTDQPAPDGLLLSDPGFLVRAVTLDHGISVLAFAFEASRQINVRKEQLGQHRLEPGPWLTRLKHHILAGELNEMVLLPDGRSEMVASLAEGLTLTRQGVKLVYATDFADTPENRKRLVGLAEAAHTLFCESTFSVREAEQARRTGHLTTRACAEIANQAKVDHLIPFHFSRRYERRPWEMYDEIAALCPRVVIPRPVS